MASEIGEFIGHGYIKNKGPVKVYATDTSRFFDCLTRRNEWIRAARDRVKFTKPPTKGK